MADARRFDEALSLCDQVLALKADNAAALNLKGFCLASQGKAGEALPLFKLARLYLPIYADIRYNLAKALEDTGDEAGAVEEYGEVLKLNSAYLDAWLNRGSLRMRRGKLDEAFADLSEAIARDPREPECFVLRGACQLLMRRPADAENDFNKALALDPRSKSRIEKLRADRAP